MPDIIGAKHERRDPENLGPRELCFRHPHTGLGGGHDQRPGIAEPSAVARLIGKPTSVGSSGAFLSFTASASGDAGSVVERLPVLAAQLHCEIKGRHGRCGRTEDQSREKPLRGIWRHGP